MKRFCFWTYILTNFRKTVLYTAITNNLAMRLVEHWIGKEGCFTTRYNVHYLVWSEETRYVLNAIDREKEIKNWPRAKKEALIVQTNPEWEFWNETILGNWPSTIIQEEEVKERWRRDAENNIVDPLSFHRQIGRGAK